MKKVFFMLGRICLSLLFICLVAHQILNWDQMQQAFDKSVSDWIVHPGIPDKVQKIFNLLLSYSSLVMVLSAIFAGVGGLLVLLGIKVRLGTVLLILFLIPSTIVMHAFWLFDGSMREEQMMLLLKNVSILGGLLILASSDGTKA
ncbi:MAG TPA: DoxX family membrane protein [Rhabdochlamydiaceae bacterium]|nr:DoxX family membrane protein [Rhabdochlamydiaceae bacterium]